MEFDILDIPIARAAEIVSTSCGAPARSALVNSLFARQYPCCTVVDSNIFISWVGRIYIAVVPPNPQDLPQPIHLSLSIHPTGQSVGPHYDYLSFFRTKWSPCTLHPADVDTAPWRTSPMYPAACHPISVNVGRTSVETFNSSDPAANATSTSHQPPAHVFHHLYSASRPAVSINDVRFVIPASEEIDRHPYAWPRHTLVGDRAVSPRRFFGKRNRSTGR